MSKGIFIVIEGSDGSGKGTQFKLLKERLKQDGHEIEVFDFPQYEKPSAYFVKEYLNGNYGDSVDPYTSSMFFALDRYSAAPKIRQALSEGKIVLANRFTGSSMAHQGGKIDNKAERLGFFTWLDNLEFETLGIPRPDFSIVLDIPADMAQKLVDLKSKRNYTDKKRDIHEADINHLNNAVNVYREIVGLFPKNFTQIDCVKDANLLSIPNINSKIWSKLGEVLPPPPGNTSSDVIENLVVKNDNNSFTITEAGEKYLSDAITNTKDNVYAFTDKLPDATVAAAMARLSRRGDDMRVTILDEFAGKAGKDEGLLKRVITAYGDDSVQQLAGIHFVIEGASNWLTKKLEWGRLAAYLEQSTRYIYFDQKDDKGNYKYFTPASLDAKTAKNYEKTMDQIFDLYSEMAHSLTEYVRSNPKVAKKERDFAWKGATRAQACDAVRPVLPVSTKSTVGVFASGQALESLIMHLMSDTMPEARETGQKLLEEARKVVPVFLERADKPDRGGASIAYQATTYSNMKKLADNKLSQNLSPESEPVQLTNYWPKNELDILPDMLYEHSSLPLDEIKQEVSEWSYEDKQRAFKTYIGERLNRRHKPGRAMEQARYSWDIVCDYGIFRDLQRHRMVDDLNWQQLSPRYGYEMPELVDEAGLGDSFEKCFDLSYKLYSQMQSAGYDEAAQYATLMGHRMRWKITYNARQAFHFHELRTAPQGHPGYRKLVKQMHDKLAEHHPMIAEAMIFVNKDEDPELTRLAGERATQFKLNRLAKTEKSKKK